MCRMDGRSHPRRDVNFRSEIDGPGDPEVTMKRWEWKPRMEKSQIPIPAIQHRMDDLWNIDVGSRKRRLTWWWWFWLLFIDDAHGRAGSSGHTGPRQFMILWSTKNCRRIRVDDEWWSPRHDITLDDGCLTFDGMAASWYFDGRTMWDPMTLERSIFRTSGDARSGALRQVGSEGHEHLFSL